MSNSNREWFNQQKYNNLANKHNKTIPPVDNDPITYPSRIDIPETNYVPVEHKVVSQPPRQPVQKKTKFNVKDTNASTTAGSSDAIIALILGIISIPTCGLIGIGAIIKGKQALRNGTGKRSFATIGMILGICSLTWTLILIGFTTFAMLQ